MQQQIRDPRDPDPVPSTKAVTALALAVVAVVTAPFIGGVIPATIALRLAGQAQEEITASGGFLTGSRRVRAGRRLARLALLLAAATVVLGLVLWLVNSIALVPGGPADHDFPSNMD